MNLRVVTESQTFVRISLSWLKRALNIIEDGAEATGHHQISGIYKRCRRGESTNENRSHANPSRGAESGSQFLRRFDFALVLYLLRKSVNCILSARLLSKFSLKKLVVEERAQEMRPIVWKARIFVRPAVLVPRDRRPIGSVT